MPIKRALLVGINQYHPLIGALGGCVNDASRIYRLLVDVYSFSSSEINLLTDSDATRDAILNGFRWLIDGAKAGDVCIMFYAGHGTRLPNFTDPSGKDEALVVFSPEWEYLFAGENDALAIFLKENWDLQFIRDKEIKASFGEIADGVNLILVMDCCHSGDMQRDIRNFPRYLDPPLRIQSEIFDAQQLYWQITNEKAPEPSMNELKLSKVQARHLVRKVFKGNRFDFLNTQERNILLAACSEKETALEKMFDGQRGGVFTHHLVNALDCPDEMLTYAELMQSLGNKMRFTPQMPHLACPKHYRYREVFS